MSLALSTSWNALRYRDAVPMIEEIRSAGFTSVELSFNLTAAMVAGVERAVQAGSVRVVSLHNVCPIPDNLSRPAALPDYYSMASTVEEERALAVRYAMRTIDTARRLGAQAVVLHCGRAALPDRTPELIRLYETGGGNTDEFRLLREEMIRRRREIVKPFFAGALKSLDELHGYAARAGIKLGIETRYYCREIPSFDEIGVILERYAGGNIYYWHDTGHAQFMENFGFCRHRDFLENYGGALLGMHIHDVAGWHDHKAPGDGDMDFGMLKSYLKPDTLRIIEVHYPADIACIRRGAAALKALLA